MTAALLLAVELFVATGPADWSPCGSNGCWRQPPLPSQFNGSTRASTFGARYGDFEVALRDLGKASVSGVFVSDEWYDENTSSFRQPVCKASRGHCVPAYQVTASQETQGLSVAYAPRWTHGALSVSPSAGLLVIRQKVVIEGTALDKRHQEPPRYEDTVTGKVTPIFGLRAAYRIGDASLGVGAEWAVRPRFMHSVAGGGEDHRIGLRMRFVELRYAF
jgi:hypothetical protein